MDLYLKETLEIEKKKNLRNLSFKHVLKLMITNDPDWLRYKFFRYMRLANYYGNSIIGIYYLKKKNKVALKLNYEINGSNIGQGIMAYHNGPIVIHKKAIIGKNLVLHGNNCIGNDGLSDDCPVLGDNVELGVGAKIIGNVRIANDVMIGAGSVVVHDIDAPGAIVVGIPGKIIKVKKSII